MKVALYARVSTLNQDEQLQLPYLRNMAKSRGYEIVGEYTDEASGRDANRPGWAALLSDARTGSFQAVFVVKLDRVMRSLNLFWRELENFQAMGIQLIAMDYGVLDPSSASGKLTISFLAAIAEWEREINSERTKAALKAKQAAGVRLGKAPRKLPTRQIALMRIAHKSWVDISILTEIPRTTILGHKAEIEKEIETITNCEKGKKRN